MRMPRLPRNVQRTCKYIPCSKIFHVSENDMKRRPCDFHSTECKDGHTAGKPRKHKTVFKCETCGGDYSELPGKMKQRAGRFCSKPCYWKSKRGGTPWNKGLKGAQTAWNKGSRISKEKSIRYTELLCKNEECHKPFLSSNSARKLGRGRYCSRKCYWNTMLGNVSWSRGKPRYNIRGKNHYNWNGGTSRENTRRRRSPETATWARDVHRKCNYRCVLCGSNKKIRADHIVPYSISITRRADVVNGQTLCLECHDNKTYRVDFPEMRRTKRLGRHPFPYAEILKQLDAGESA